MSTDDRVNRIEKRHQNRVADWEIVEIEMVVREVKGIHEIITAKKLMELLKK
jgi:hypothetical protein